MKNFRKNLPITNIGITTIITVFIILCLVTFASLTYVNALNDSSASRKSTAHNDEYYEAYNEANKTIASVGKELYNIYSNYPDKELTKIEEEYIFSYPVGDSHALYVTLVPAITKSTNLNSLSPIEYIQDNELSIYKITSFEVVITSDWNGENTTVPLQTFEQE